MHPNFRWVGMSLDGETVTLRRFSSTFSTPQYFNPDWARENKDKIRVGAVVDVETTGLNKKFDAIIEIGVRSFLFNRATGDLLESGEAYNGLQDPGKPLSDEIIRLTGLTDEALKNQNIDWAVVSRLISSANVVIAHNAAFDRPFIERMTESSADKAWACSYKHIDWHGKGFTTSKLDVLSIYHGFYTDSHRALSDVDALLNLLSMQDWQTRKPYMNELLTNARRPLTRVVAANSPFESKDALKERGYNWDSNDRVWLKTIYKDELEKEIAWMESAVYKGEFRGRVFEIALTDNFKSTA